MLSSPAWADTEDKVAIGHLKVSKSLFSQPGEFTQKLAVCESCHGKNGAGDADFGPDAAFGTPAMRGLTEAYMITQLEAYRAGERTHAEMTPMVTLLSKEDGQALSAHFAALPAPAPLTSPTSVRVSASQIKQGEVIATQGASCDASTACITCHQPLGVGAGGVFPRLAGQNAVYITRQLNAWRSGERKNPSGMAMAAIAKKLSPEDIQAVAAYYEALVPR